jgi:lipopolysaccharide/colanic/teichoic acid biosynthesis glycosyltransferase
VLTGQMSFVGPRPQMLVDFDVYPHAVREVITDVPPGVTGIGSVVFRDEERLLSQPGVDAKAFYADSIAPYKGELERWYLQHVSFWTDFRILVLTGWVIVFPRSRAPWRVFRTLPARPAWLD